MTQRYTPHNDRRQGIEFASLQERLEALVETPARHKCKAPRLVSDSQAWAQLDRLLQRRIAEWKIVRRDLGVDATQRGVSLGQIAVQSQRLTRSGFCLAPPLDGRHIRSSG
jgi:hypothetical protein